MQKFFQSELYKNFWLFSLKCAFWVGLLSAAGLTTADILQPAAGTAPLEISMPIVVFMVGASYGFVSGALGFWLLWALLRSTKGRHFRTLAFGTALALAIAVMIHFFRGNITGLSLALPLLYFPVIPAIICVYVFVKLAHKHVRAPDLI